MFDWVIRKYKNSVGNVLWINCLLEFICVVTVGVFTTFIVDCNDFTITEFYRWAAITICFFAQVYFARSGVTKKNIFDMKLFLALSLLTAVTIYTKFAIFIDKCDDIPISIYVLIGFVGVLVIINLYFFCAAYEIVKDRFLTELMLRNALTEEEQMKYNLWCEIKALVSLNTIFQILVLMGYFTFYDYEESDDSQNDTFYVIDSLVLLTFLIFSRVGYVALISVNKVDNLNVFLVFGVVLNIYEAVRWFLLIPFAYSEKSLVDYKYSVIASQGVATGIGIVIQILLIKRCIPFVKIGNEYLRGYYSVKSDRSSSSMSRTQKTYSDMFDSGRKSNTTF